MEHEVDRGWCQTRQSRHQIGEADSGQLPPGVGLMLALVLSLCLWGFGWTVMVLLVNAWVQPWQ